MNKAGFRNWVEQNKQEDEQVLWAGSPRMVYFRGLFFTRVIPGLGYGCLLFLGAYMLRHTFYIITNRRVLKARVLSQRVRQWPLEVVARARRIDYRDGLSSYIFEEWDDGPHRHERISRGIYFVTRDFNEALEKAECRRQNDKLVHRRVAAL